VGVVIPPGVAGSGISEPGVVSVAVLSIVDVAERQVSVDTAVVSAVFVAAFVVLVEVDSF
jgi:hypothetical protein